LRVRADEHIAPAIVDAITSIAPGEGFELSSVLREGFGGSTDEHWITAFAAAGGQVILSADTDFLKQPPQVQAIERTGLRLIHLPSGWANASRAIQAGHLLLWWPRIEAQIKQMRPRECYTTPFQHSASALKRVPLDFQKANRKVRKAR
jgi:hypothetical protein